MATNAWLSGMSPGGFDSVTTGWGAGDVSDDPLEVDEGAGEEGAGDDAVVEASPGDDPESPGTVDRELVEPDDLLNEGTEGVVAVELQPVAASMMTTVMEDAATETGDIRMTGTLGTAGQAPGERKVNVRLPSRPLPLRRRVTGAILGVTATALLVFAAPLAYAVQQLYQNEELSNLQRDAVRIAALVPDTPQEAVGKVPARPPGLGVGVHFGVYDASGHRLGGEGPEQSALAASAADGRAHGVVSQGFAASAPVPSDGLIAVTVLTTSDAQVADQRTVQAWSVMALLAGVVLLAAGVVARLQARRLARPLEELTAGASALGEGDFTIRPTRSGIAEVDDAAAALARTAARLGQVRERERSFARDVSHQLRTPLAGLLLGLENAIGRDDDGRVALQQALDRGRKLQAISDDLLALTRHGTEPGAILEDVLRDTEDRWHGVLADAGRRLLVRIPTGLTTVTGPAAALRQIVDVLVDNALRHGKGAVTITATELPHGIAVTVADEGAGMPQVPDTGGLGLPLAVNLAAASGALLHMPDPGAPSEFRLLLPTTEDGYLAES